MPPSHPAQARDVPSLLDALKRQEPGRPRITWYGLDGERVELSAAVLGNWVAKTANLLVDELGAGPGTRVGIDLPPHWRTLVWLLATWSAGACAVLRPDDDVDVLVTTSPEAAAAVGGDRAVLVALPALAAGCPGGVPAGVLDGAAEVRAQGDVFTPLDRPSATDAALGTPADVVRHGDLLAAARSASATRPGARVLVDGALPLTATSVLAQYLGPLAAGGSLVLHHDLSGLAPERRAALTEQERIDS